MLTIVLATDHPITTQPPQPLTYRKIDAYPSGALCRAASATAPYKGAARDNSSRNPGLSTAISGASGRAAQARSSFRIGAASGL